MEDILKKPDKKPNEPFISQWWAKSFWKQKCRIICVHGHACTHVRIHTGVYSTCVCVFFVLCVWELCVHCHSPAVAGKVPLPLEERERKEKRSATRWQVPFCGAQRATDRKDVFIENSWRTTQLCVLWWNTCGWGKSSRNYTPIGIWPLIMWTCERGRFGECSLSRKEKGKGVWIKCTSISGWFEGHTHSLECISAHTALILKRKETLGPWPLLTALMWCPHDENTSSLFPVSGFHPQ